MNGEAAARLARVQAQGEDLSRPAGDRADIRWLCALVRELEDELAAMREARDAEARRADVNRELLRAGRVRVRRLADLIAAHREQGNGDGHGPDNRRLWDGAEAAMGGGQT